MDNFPLNLLTFPIWWYKIGFTFMREWTKKEMRFGLSKTGIVIFARHLREPLYGDYTKSGIIISFFLRIILIIFKATMIGVRFLILAILNVAYLLLLPAIILMVIYQFLGIKTL